MTSIAHARDLSKADTDLQPKEQQGVTPFSAPSLELGEGVGLFTTVSIEGSGELARGELVGQFTTSV